MRSDGQLIQQTPRSLIDIHKDKQTNSFADAVTSDLVEAEMLSVAAVHPTSVTSSSTVWCWQAVVRHCRVDTCTMRVVRRFSKATGESCWGGQGASNVSIVRIN